MPSISQITSVIASKDFKQQTLRAWQPLLTPLTVILFFLIVGVVFIPVGIALLYASHQVVEFSVPYASTNLPPCGDVCTFTVNIDKRMDTPVYMYYQLDNYYQNHRRYAKSRNDDQLSGTILTDFASLTDCDPRKSIDGNKSIEYFYVPCGLVAYSRFTDNYELYDSAGTEVELKKEGIAWSSDKDMFKNPDKKVPGIHVVKDVTDEDFIVWMRTAALPSFKKLYRKIEGPDYLYGNYTLVIHNNYPVLSFGGRKTVVLSTVTWIGGKNPVLGWAYIATGDCALIFAAAFLIKQIVRPRKLADLTYLDWEKSRL